MVSEQEGQDNTYDILSDPELLEDIVKFNYLDKEVDSDNNLINNEIEEVIND
jgi:hypothetical protein